jgi:hypothetical protein
MCRHVRPKGLAERSARRVRNAGIRDAAIPISVSTKVTRAKVAGSAALTEYGTFAIKRLRSKRSCAAEHDARSGDFSALRRREI